MKRWAQSQHPWMVLVGALAVGLLACGAGCQVEMGGQTLPSPYYMQDDVQYFAPGPEFRLAREAAALKAARGEVLPPAAPAGQPGQAPPPEAGAQPPAPAQRPAPAPAQPPGPGPQPPAGPAAPPQAPPMP
ncbi:MAG: hypothetical protein NZ899_10645 [Thermoguttaceae bacterium]|nr:hypothetical protein [Thermoguttaceae bacterium]MDW8078926.1 hypothetical protein [Thermoguttaceae bacterium]